MATPVADTLRFSTTFRRLQPADRDRLAEVARVHEYSRGATIFNEGDPSNFFFTVVTGRVKVFKMTPTGKDVILEVFGGGDPFGATAAYEGRPFPASAVALEDTELIVLNRENLQLFFQKKPDAALDMIAAMGAMIRKADDILRTRVSRNANLEVEEKLTVVQHAADWIAAFSGSMPFLVLNTLWFVCWVVINTFDLGIGQFDPFPFGLLTMIVSLEAIFLSIFVVISQNRQAEKDRVRSNIDYEVNVKAEMEVAFLHEKTDRLYEKMQEQFSRLEKSIVSNREEESIRKGTGND